MVWVLFFILIVITTIDLDPRDWAAYHPHPQVGEKQLIPQESFWLNGPVFLGAIKSPLSSDLHCNMLYSELQSSHLRDIQISKKLLQSTITFQSFWSFYVGFSFYFHLHTPICPYVFIAQIYFCVMAPSAPL